LRGFDGLNGKGGENMPVTPEKVAEMFRGLSPSKQAKEIVGRALDNGVDPSYHVNQAVENARKNGKRKVCVQRGGPLQALKEAVLRRTTT